MKGGGPAGLHGSGGPVLSGKLILGSQGPRPITTGARRQACNNTPHLISQEHLKKKGKHGLDYFFLLFF